MSVKTSIKTKATSKNKRIIIDYSQNFDLDYVLSQLQSYYAGLSKAEITKLAIVELFRLKTTSNIPYLSDAEEESLKQAMANKGQLIRVPENVNFSQFVLDENI